MSPLLPQLTSLFGFGLFFLGVTFLASLLSWILLPGILSSSAFPFPGALATGMSPSPWPEFQFPFPHLKPLMFIFCTSLLYDINHLGALWWHLPPLLSCSSCLSYLRRAHNYLLSQSWLLRSHHAWCQWLQAPILCPCSLLKPLLSSVATAVPE